MISYELQGAMIQLPVTDLNQHGMLIIEGEKSGEILDVMLSQFGVYGRIFQEFTAGADLAYVLKSDPMKKYAPKLTEGAEILAGELSLGIPPGCIP